MNIARCLVVDDEPDIRELLKMTLERMKPPVECVAVENITQARDKLNNQLFGLCLTDMKLPDGNGIELVEHIQMQYPNLPVAMITAYGDMDSAVSAMKAGAFDFISKPVDLTTLRDLVAAAFRLSGEADSEVASTGDMSELIGESEAIQQLRIKIRKLARSQAPAYISGESGAGKELAARLIHSQGPRAEQPFVPVNCGAIPSELMESEFFGHKKGSFTGAVSDKTGLFQAAHGGTLFLDEVADLPLPMQVKLLRAIQEKKIRPVGEHKEIMVDVRIISATHKPLAELVQRGEFRQDLFYRINVIELKIPPLRERVEDIPLFVNKILNELMETNGLDAKPEVTGRAMQALQSYTFPGNVRELENILERAITLCEENRITEEDLQLPEAEEDAVVSTSVSSQSSGLDPMLDDMQKQTILNALEQTRWNKTKAAKLLGISFSALRYRIQKLNLDDDKS